MLKAWWTSLAGDPESNRTRAHSAGSCVHMELGLARKDQRGPGQNLQRWPENSNRGLEVLGAGVGDKLRPGAATTSGEASVHNFGVEKISLLVVSHTDGSRLRVVSQVAAGRGGTLRRMNAVGSLPRGQCLTCTPNANLYGRIPPPERIDRRANGAFPGRAGIDGQHPLRARAQLHASCVCTPSS
eukprot:scaffold694_cov188-Prasinococcus_capsulatus_cf.AAC.6